MTITLAKINRVLLKLGLLLVVIHSCDCGKQSNIKFELITAREFNTRPKI